MNKLQLITAIFFLFLLIFALQACNLATQETIPVVELIDRTKPPFEPPNRTQTVQAELTATSAYTATQVALNEIAETTRQAELTATAVVRDNEIMAYQYYESFDENSYNWREGLEENPYWQGVITLDEGRYIWEVFSFSDPFVAWSIFNPEQDLADFDVAINARRVVGPAHQHCFGLLFRRSPDGFNSGSYTLSVCDQGYYKILYYDSEQGWDVIHDWTPVEVILEDDWNLIEVSARGEDFTITFNHQQQISFSDSRLTSGAIAIMIDIYGDQPGQINFDMFALQPQ